MSPRRPADFDMRLAIADPPYLRRSVRWYGDGRGHYKDAGTRADVHPEAAEWDDPARHVQLVAQLVDEFDGWAIACTPDALATYLPALPPAARIGVWNRGNGMPSGSRITNRWEPLIFLTPAPRRGRGTGLEVGDVLTEGVNVRSGFVGAKPPAWTRWALSLLGYDPARDELVDLFPGSGAVSAAADGLLSMHATERTP